MGYAFPKNKRIHRNQDFQRIIRQGRSAGGKHIRIFFEVVEKGEERFGVTVSRRIKRSAQRNRYKRLIREYFRLQQNTRLQGMEMIALVKSDMEKPSLETITNEMNSLIGKRENSRG